MRSNQKNSDTDIQKKPCTGTIFAVAAGISFYFLCMILPLVGQAGSRTSYAVINKLAFLGILILTLALAGLASYIKLKQQKEWGGSRPYFSLGISAICLLSFIVLLANGFSI